MLVILASLLSRASPFAQFFFNGLFKAWEVFWHSSASTAFMAGACLVLVVVLIIGLSERKMELSSAELLAQVAYLMQSQTLSAQQPSKPRPKPKPHPDAAPTSEVKGEPEAQSTEMEPSSRRPEGAVGRSLAQRIRDVFSSLTGRGKAITVGRGPDPPPESIQIKIPSEADQESEADQAEEVKPKKRPPEEHA